MIVQQGKKFMVKSESGRPLGTYDTRAAAEKRLAQVEMFKAMRARGQKPRSK